MTRRFDWEVPTGPILADWFDGEKGTATRVQLIQNGTDIELHRSDGTALRLSASTLRSPPDQASPGATAFALSDGSNARLVTDDQRGIEMIQTAHPDASKPPALPSQGKQAITVTVIGVAVLGLLIFGLLPGLARVLASGMSADAEVALGDIHYNQSLEYFGGLDDPLRECTNPAGVAALDALTERVTGDLDLPYPLQVAVVDDFDRPMMNAYAVAGGRITFFNEIIQRAERPEEIAAILAHELGHVVNQDPVAGMLEGASATAIMALLAGDVSGGGVIGGFAGTALTSSYSRRAELAADSFATDQLTAVGLPPSALGTLFGRLRDANGDVEGVLQHFSTHPALADRIGEANAAGDPPIGAPALTPKAWAALKQICN